MPMSRTLADARRWTEVGTAGFLAATDGLAEIDFDAPTLLPGWTRRNLIAHVAANADALGNLVHWAATGEMTPMYASPEERAAGIERGTKLTTSELTAWVHDSARRLEASMAALTDEQWGHMVVSAQGREVSATETVWMRAREVCIHTIDLDRGAAFDDLPRSSSRHWPPTYWPSAARFPRSRQRCPNGSRGSPVDRTT